MADFWKRARDLLLLKARFATTSLVATVVDYGLYVILVECFLEPVPSNIISYSCGMVLNFLLQKRYVFSLQRSVRSAFGLAILVSLGGMGLSTLIVWGLSQTAFFYEYQFLTKLVATGTVFFYNFYLKRFVFEKRFL